MTLSSVAGPPTGVAAEVEFAKALDAAPRVDLGRHLQAALRLQRRWSAIVAEIWRLSRGPGRLSPHEYFYYRLYEDGLSFAEKREFVGKRAQHPMHHACNDATWHAAVDDKLLFHAAMSGAGFPVPRVLAVHHRFRRAAGAPRLADAEEIAAFLRRGMRYPFFAKPIDGMYSLGAASIDAYDAAADELVAAGGARLRVDALAETLSGRDGGYLIQDRLRPHPEIAELFGPRRLATVRFLVFVTPRGPELFRALCKIPTGANIADNFWRPGNMLGAVDLADGGIRRVVRGVGEDRDLPTHHPDTGREILGRRLPLWPQLKELCLAAAATLPGVRTQAWDIAIAEAGPVLIEVNYGGDLNLPQLAWGRGVLDERYRAHLRECGYKGRL